jgi:DNA repair photolyase
MMSIGTIHDAERKVLEPHASPIDERLNVLKECSTAGIQTSVFFGPMYPTISVDDIPEILDTFSAQGASKIWIDSLNLKPGIWENIKHVLREEKEMYALFSKNVYENPEYYPHLRSTIHKVGKRKHMDIIDAF